MENIKETDKCSSLHVEFHVVLCSYVRDVRFLDVKVARLEGHRKDFMERLAEKEEANSFGEFAWLNNGESRERSWKASKRQTSEVRYMLNSMWFCVAT